MPPTPATDGDTSSVTPRADLLAGLDALAQHLDGLLVVSVVINDRGDRRRYLYRNADAAERAVARAKQRGREAHVTLARLLPVGVVSAWSDGGGLR